VQGLALGESPNGLAELYCTDFRAHGSSAEAVRRSNNACMSIKTGDEGAAWLEGTPTKGEARVSPTVDAFLFFELPGMQLPPWFAAQLWPGDLEQLRGQQRQKWGVGGRPGAGGPGPAEG